MGYVLGIDLGTTYSAAAIMRGDSVDMVSLGVHSATIPSVLFLKEDGTFMVGDAAARRGLADPTRVAREFKRRVGDTTPLMLGGTPVSAEALMSRVLAWVLAEVTQREGSAPDRVAVTHPANWGKYKTDLLLQAARMAALPNPMLVTEPEAAALAYAATERIDVGNIVAVYDFGGGTFDAVVLRRSDQGFELMGAPEGIERLGGIDFDAAVFAHVTRALGGAIEQLDQSDPAAIAAVGRLRDECRQAKEALSADTDTSIPVVLPSVQTEVRLTRDELEAMIRPTLADTVGALGRALQSAGVAAEHVSKVLLVGGSSRVPLVAELVGAELRRPVALDAHPKHVVAIGAALAAGGLPALSAENATPVTPTVHLGQPESQPYPAAQPVRPQPVQPQPVQQAVAAYDTTTGQPLPPTQPQPAYEQPAQPQPAQPAAAAYDATTGQPLAPTQPQTPQPAYQQPAQPQPAYEQPVQPPPTQPQMVQPAAAAYDTITGQPLPPTQTQPAHQQPQYPQAGQPSVPGPSVQGPAVAKEPKKRTGLVVGIVALVVVLGAVAAAALVLRGRSDSTQTATGNTAPASPSTTRALPAACAERSGDFACITYIAYEGDDIVVDYMSKVPLTLEGTPGSRHLHFYFNTVPPEQSGVPGSGPWEMYAGPSPGTFRKYTKKDIPPFATMICVTLVDAEHKVVSDSGNCSPLPSS